MSRFLQDTDYSVLIRSEIKNILLEDVSQTKLLIAEQMAIAQIRNYLAGRYNVDEIFAQEEEARNHFIVMITMDCTLYHLYTAQAPNKIPALRSERYQDAITWLRDMLKGNTTADLPLLQDATGNIADGIRIASNYKADRNKW